ncbi:MAG TPA: serine/threonine protein kinase [Firmicutes bacterium]|nr:serine/threonine protein kinase [Bacillota bacterium]
MFRWPFRRVQKDAAIDGGKDVAKATSKDFAANHGIDAAGRGIDAAGGRYAKTLHENLQWQETVADLSVSRPGGEEPASGSVPSSTTGRGGWSDLPPAMKERFTDMQLIGRGSSGAVYFAFDQDLERPVALKMLTRSPGTVPIRQIAQREARAVAALHHPNIITLYDWFGGEEAAWLVMEYVEGESLATRLERGPVPWREAVDMVTAVCEGLQYAHEHGVWHLDIKPGNVLISTQGVVKITDFGIAERPTMPPAAGSGWGTPGFAAPEQLAGAPCAQSDVYAVAALLWALVTGGETPPSPHDKMEKGCWRAIPLALRAPLRAALSANPKARPAEPALLAAALRRARDAGTAKAQSITDRVWEVGITGFFAGAVAALTTGTGPLAVYSGATGYWGVLFLALLAIIRPLPALMAAYCALMIAMLRQMPTYGFLLLVCLPFLILIARINRISLGLLLIGPLLLATGQPFLIAVLAGILLPPAAAVWAALGSTVLSFAVGHLVSSPITGRYLQMIWQMQPEEPLRRLLGIVLRISPLDIKDYILPTLWQGASSPLSMWLALVAAITATGLTWGQSRLEPKALAGLLLVLFLGYQVTSLILGQPFSGLAWFIAYALASLAVFLSPSRAAASWEAVSGWIAGRFSR